MGFIMTTVCVTAVTLLLMSATCDRVSVVAATTTKLTANAGNSHQSPQQASDETADGQSTAGHAVLKRSFSPFYGGWNGAGQPASLGGGSSANSAGWNAVADWSGLGSSAGFLDSWNGHRASGPSPTEVANAIAMAKQASANVLIAQQQVQAAKDNVLHQQRLATDKETHASILTQKSEAAAAIQRSEAAAAAQSVILAQQRLAAAKNMVAQQQRIAAAKEAQAAQALHNSAHAAAAEIQRTEQEAARLATAHRSDSAAASHHLSATKDVILGPLHAGNNHVPNVAFHQQQQPHNAGLAAYATWPQTFAASGAGNPDWLAYTSAAKPAYNPWG